MDYPFAWPPESVVAPGPYFQWSRTVVFDFHEVCVSWKKSFADFVNKLYGRNIDPEQFNFYNMQLDPSVDLSPDEFNEAFNTFVQLAVGGYGDLDAFDGIKETMDAIKAAGIGIDIWTWTPGSGDGQTTGSKPFPSGDAQVVTLQLIERLGLPVDAVRFMKTYEKKVEMVEERIPLIIEDSPETVVGVGLGMAHAAILVPEKYNEGLLCPNVLRLKSREDLARTVIEFFQALDDAGVLL
jgi:hypothetical protein